MDEAEDHLWWYRALHAYLIDALLAVGTPVAASSGVTGSLPCLLPNNAPILDAGCGTGGLLRLLAQAAPQRPRFGLDYLEPAAARARAKSGAAVTVGSVNTLPFGDNLFGVIVSADVLYHRNVDASRALRESFRCLMPGGVLLVNVPAFQWLSSYHDQRVHGARRFRRGELKGLLEAAGFTTLALHYWNSLLFPVMVARRLRPGAADAASDVRPMPRAVDAGLRAIVALERKMIRLGLRFPAGGSILAVAYRP